MRTAERQKANIPDGATRITNKIAMNLLMCISKIEIMTHLVIADSPGDHFERLKIQRLISVVKDIYAKRKANVKSKFAEIVVLLTNFKR